MKIGLLNPWRFAAETQAIAQIVQVARAQGHLAVECGTTEDVLREAPDLVLAMSIGQPKLTAVPTYGMLYTPCRAVAENPGSLQVLLSYDGYFTISDRQRAFMTDVLVGVGREEDIGVFYTTSLNPEWTSPVPFATARLAYFGTNWDWRQSDLFRRLEHYPWMEIYGPEETWRFLTGHAYRGRVPFDGLSVLERYRTAGMGLALLSRPHLADDLITMRVFEIAAAGAIAIAPAMPWLERNFGDALLYVDQTVGPEELAQQVVSHVEWVWAHPDEAAARAHRAHEIFRERFSYEVLLPNVIAYHAARCRQAAAAGEDTSLVSVIVRSAGRPASHLRRAVDTVVAQRHRRLELILALHGPGDAGPMLADVASRFERVEVISMPGARRSAVLVAGLAACRGDDIALLDDDAEWLPDHVADLVGALRRSHGGRLAFSGLVRQHRERVLTTEGHWEIRSLAPWPREASSCSIVDHAVQIDASAFLFPRELLDPSMLRDPELTYADHTHLILALREKTTPVFTYRSTAVRHERDDEGGRAEAQDLARLRLRFFGRSFPPAPRLIGTEDLKKLDLGDREAPDGPGEPRGAPGIQRRPGVSEYPIPISLAAALEAETDWKPTPVEIDMDRVGLRGETTAATAESLFPLTVVPPAGSWQYGLELPIAFPEARAYVVRLRGRVESGQAGFGVLCRSEERFTYRTFIAKQSDDLIIDLPVPDPSDTGRIVVEAGDAAEPVRVVLQSVELLEAGPRVPA